MTVESFGNDPSALGAFFRQQQGEIARRLRGGASLASALEMLVRALEEKANGSFVASVLLLDESGTRLRHGAGPSLPPQYNAAIDGIEVGPIVGSCGTAAYLGHPIYVADIATDPLWANFKELALQHGLRACWSVPLEDEDGHVIGTFAIYHREPRSPTERERRIIDAAARTAATIIELAQIGR